MSASKRFCANFEQLIARCEYESAQRALLNWLSSTRSIIDTLMFLTDECAFGVEQIVGRNPHFVDNMNSVLDSLMTRGLGLMESDQIAGKSEILLVVGFHWLARDWKSVLSRFEQCRQSIVFVQSRGLVVYALDAAISLDDWNLADSLIEHDLLGYLGEWHKLIQCVVEAQQTWTLVRYGGIERIRLRLKALYNGGVRRNTSVDDTVQAWFNERPDLVAFVRGA